VDRFGRISSGFALLLICTSSAPDGIQLSANPFHHEWDALTSRAAKEELTVEIRAEVNPLRRDKQSAPSALISKTIKTDNGSEFISKVMDKWAYERGVELDFSRPGEAGTAPAI
jgi:hypothetical protein